MIWEDHLDEQEGLKARAIDVLKAVAQSKEPVHLIESKLVITGLINGGGRRRITSLDVTTHEGLGRVRRVTVEYDES